jgi:hypothetical protein
MRTTVMTRLPGFLFFAALLAAPVAFSAPAGAATTTSTGVEAASGSDAACVRRHRMGPGARAIRRQLSPRPGFARRAR